MYIIQSGHVRISRRIDGREHTLAELGSGDFFGEMAIVNSVRRSATATAMDEVHLLCFDRAGFQSMIEKNGKLAMNVIDKLCRRLSRANRQIQHYFQRSELNFLALNLHMRFAERGPEDESLSYDRAVNDIAGVIGLSHDVIRRGFGRLAAMGIIEVTANAIRIKDRDKLKSLAEQPSA
jgi:CRP-like cAMP-binding protein